MQKKCHPRRSESHVNCLHPYDSLATDCQLGDPSVICGLCGSEMDPLPQFKDTFWLPELNYNLIRVMANTYKLFVVGTPDNDAQQFELDTRKSLIFEVMNQGQTVWFGIELQPERCIIVNLKTEDRVSFTHDANDWVRALAKGFASIRV